MTNFYLSKATLLISLSIFIIVSSITLYTQINVYQIQQKHCADIIFINGFVWTGNLNATSLQSRKAKSFVVIGNKFAAVSNDSSALMEQYYCASSESKRETKVIDGKNKLLAVPGFYDAHVHTISAGAGLLSVPLGDCRSLDHFKARIQEFASINKLESSNKLAYEKGETNNMRWIRRGEWNHEAFEGEDRGILPSRFLIDSVTPFTPVWVCRIDGHMCLANTIAIKLANISLVNPPLVTGGSFDMQFNEETNRTEISGIIRDNAMKYILNIIPPRTKKEEDQSLHAAMDYFVANGVTTIHNMADDAFSPIFDDVKAFERRYWLATNNGVTSGNETFPMVRSIISPPIYGIQAIKKYILNNQTKINSDWLRVNSTKSFFDGALGSQTMKMFKPFETVVGEGGSDNTGLYVTSETDLFNYMKDADDLNVRLNIHAIGTRATSTLVHLYNNTLARSKFGNFDRRFTIEHCQHIFMDDILKLAEVANTTRNNGNKLATNVIVSVQPYHLIDDAPYVERVIGRHRLNSSYAFKSLIDNGIIVTFGSDWFVAPAKPILGIDAAVNRKYYCPQEKKMKVFLPHERVSVDEALMAYTYYASFAERNEDKNGVIATGFLADFVILDQDITSPTLMDHIKNTKILETYIDGIKMF